MRVFLTLQIALLVVQLVITDADAGWFSDRMKATNLRELGEYTEAYRAAVSNKSTRLNDVCDRNFLAGWIALRDLNRPELALEHFKKMAKTSLKLKGHGVAATYAKSNYWLAKALNFAGHLSESTMKLKKASIFLNTFYGQLALAELGSKIDISYLDRFSNQYPNYQYYWRDDRVQREYVLAVIREESSFASHSESSDGAIGLMQLMPETAKDVGGNNGIETHLPRLNSSPDYNVVFGTYFLAKMFEKYNGNGLLAIAAYNAGPKKVDSWIPRFGDPRTDSIDPVEWIENIPYLETKLYVQSVLSSYMVYKALNAKNSKQVHIGNSN